MTKLTERTTIYLDPRIKKSVQFYALRDDSNLSEIVNNMLFEYLEDMSDLAVIEERKNEPTVPFDVVIKELGISLNEIQNYHKTSSAKRTKKASA